jgi:hypothetical protein
VTEPKRNKRAAHKSADRARLLRYHEQYKELIAGYGDDHPDWQAQALCWLMKYAIRNLRHYVETNLGGRITEAPCLTFHFPVDWNWEVWRRSQGASGSMNLGKLTAANTRTRKRALKTLAWMMVKHVMILAMQELTGNVGCEKHGDRLIPILPADATGALSAVKGKKERQAVLEALFQPFCVGVAPIQVDIEKLTRNAPVPKELSRQLAQASKLIHLPALEWTLTVDRHRMRAMLVFQIHPFVVEPKRKAAYFPLTIGLNIAPDESDGEKLLRLLNEPWADAANWSKADKEQIWSAIVQTLEQLAMSFGPKPSRELEEAILSVSAQLKIVGPAGTGEDKKAILNRLLKSFAKTGEVLHWECDTVPAGAGVRQIRWQRLSDADFERLIFDLVSSARGYENAQWLTHTNAADRGRDLSVDRVSTDSLSGTRRLRVIVQCRHKKCVGVGEVSQLKEQMVLWEPPRVDELIVATPGRFSTDAVQWIEKHNESNHSLRIIMWPDSHLEKLLAQRPHLLGSYGLR